MRVVFGSAISRLFLVLFLVFLPALIQLSGCSDDDPVTIATAPEVTELAALKLPTPGCSGIDGNPDPGVIQAYEDCIEYNYDRAGTLSFNHLSAWFNCCTDSFDVNICLCEGEITITERMVLLNGGCDCDCPYDLAYEVENLEPGEYTITVVNPYKCHIVNYPQLSFTVDLVATPSGTFCIDRCGLVGE